VLGERVKAFLAWQNAINTLQKKREQRSRMELGGKLDRMGAVLEVRIFILENLATESVSQVESIDCYSFFYPILLCRIIQNPWGAEICRIELYIL
jgi:hypothetical protein